jgi:hypothetical protein
MGVVLVVCGGLTGPRDLDPTGRLSPRHVRTLTWLLVALLAVQLPRGLAGSPAHGPEQLEVLRRVEEIDERCRAHHIAAADARAALGEFPLPGGNGESAWLLLRGSDDPRPISREKVRLLLSPE